MDGFLALYQMEIIRKNGAKAIIEVIERGATGALRMEVVKEE